VNRFSQISCAGKPQIRAIYIYMEYTKTTTNNQNIRLSQIRYSLVVICELNSIPEVQYKDVMMIDDEKYQQE